MSDELPFWKAKPLISMSSSEWESLCDGCGRCCLVRLEDEDTADIHDTILACRLLDGETCRCTDYENRLERVHDCVKVSPGNISGLSWMPRSCAYRRLAEGRDLAWWHPLVSGSFETVVEAGISVRDKTLPEDSVAEQDYGNFLFDWPEEDGGEAR